MVAASKSFSLLSLVALSAGSSAGSGEVVTLYKAGFPESFVNKRAACGQRTATKSWLSAEYWSRLVYGGFRQGTCTDAGFPHFERTETVEAAAMPFGFDKETVDFEIYSQDPGAFGVAVCMAKKCQPEISAVVHSGYTQEALGCIRPAFGPCVPKAWACLGDEKCRSAVECVPRVAAKCGVNLMQMLSNHEERDRLMCMQKCQGSKLCILKKCGKAALSCLWGSDKLCHETMTCVSSGLASCTIGATSCLLSWSDGICRDNAQCLIAGANTCADPAVNALTDTSIGDLVTCTNEKCPAVASPATASQELTVSSTVGFQLPHYPQQLACMAYHCTGKLTALVEDQAVHDLVACFPPALEECGADVWGCLGDERCLADVTCWSEGLMDFGKDVWAMLTESPEREFDEALVRCMAECTEDGSMLVKSACLVGKCGLKATHCLADSNCRKLLVDFPVLGARCGFESIRELMNTNSSLSRSVRCGFRMAGRCGTQAVELLRDRNIASLLQCNSQCTRAPANSSQQLIVV